MAEHETYREGFRCDACGERQQSHALMHGCRECNYDVCARCLATARA